MILAIALALAAQSPAPSLESRRHHIIIDQPVHQPTTDTPRPVAPHHAWKPGDTAYLTDLDPRHGYLVGSQVTLIQRTSPVEWFVSVNSGRGGKITVLESALSLAPFRYPAPAPPKILPAPAPPPKSPPIAVAPTDPYGFGVTLNTYRARHRLPPLAYSPAVAADCAENSRRGFGHNFFGRCRRQNVGSGPLAVIFSSWAADPPHAAALLDPSATCYGIAVVGNVWTFGAN